MDSGTQRQYNFSIGVLESEKVRLEHLCKFLSPGVFLDKLYAQKASVHKAILKLQNKPCDFYIDSLDHKYAISLIRRNLNWLNRQSHITNPRKVIDEINEVSRILTTK
jgi:hypothetical protein